MALVTGTSGGQRAIPGRFYIVAMCVQQLAVADALFATEHGRQEVILLTHVFTLEVESTPGTLPLLPLQQSCDVLRKLRVCSQPCCPVHPIPVERAFCAPDFDMSPDRGAIVFEQAHSVSGGKVPGTLVQPPVFPDDPVPGFMGVPTFGPAPELQVGEGCHLGEGSLGLHGRIVGSPAPDYRVEPGDQGGLRGRFVLFNDLSQCQ